jgi:hypothetical protein
LEILEVMDWGKKQRFAVKQLYVGRVLAALRTDRLGLTEVGNGAKPLKYSEEKLYFVPI